MSVMRVLVSIKRSIWVEVVMSETDSHVRSEARASRIAKAKVRRSLSLAERRQSQVTMIYTGRVE